VLRTEPRERNIKRDNMEALVFAFTFLFGVLRLITFIKVFDATISTFFGGLFGVTNSRHTVIGGILVWTDNAIFYGSLFYQIWFWYLKLM